MQPTKTRGFRRGCVLRHCIANCEIGFGNEKDKTRKVPRLSRNATDEDIVRWTKSHDVFDRLETGVSEIIENHSDLDQLLRDAIFQDNTAQLNMRLPPAIKAVLSKLARQRTTDATTLAASGSRNGWNRTKNKLKLRRLKRRFFLTYSDRACGPVIPASQ